MDLNLVNSGELVQATLQVDQTDQTDQSSGLAAAKLERNSVVGSRLYLGDYATMVLQLSQGLAAVSDPLVNWAKFRILLSAVQDPPSSVYRLRLPLKKHNKPLPGIIEVTDPKLCLACLMRCGAEDRICPIPRGFGYMIFHGGCEIPFRTAVLIVGNLRRSFPPKKNLRTSTWFRLTGRSTATLRHPFFNHSSNIHERKAETSDRDGY
ncbi:hypothetical protein C8R45DRAFT_1069223 [Mycena sanguinolenta]|nr:hypothetical protein C8R45DRAFT_1069223 [Mycena sanguinolenta]